MRLLILIAIFVFTSAAFASGKPYGKAGCGFGSVLFGKSEPQILAATTNSLSTQTFSISSGTSNCVNVDQNVARIRNFIEANYETLITEMSKGKGDTVYTLSSLYGCDKNSFASGLQKNYSKVVTQNDSADYIMQRIGRVIVEEDIGPCSYAI